MHTHEKARGLPVEIQKSILLTPDLKANTITGTIMETLDGPEDDEEAPETSPLVVVVVAGLGE